MVRLLARPWTVLASAALCMAPWSAAATPLAPPPQTQGSDSGYQVSNRPECDFHGIPDDSVPLSGPITGIPEFHDCQRFVEGGAYIGRYAIFARYWGTAAVSAADSGQVPDPAQIEPAQTTPLAIVDSGIQMEIENGTVVTLPLVTSTVGTPFATIYSYDTQRYEPLGIDPGWNCLYLFVDPHRGDWRATIVSQGTNPDCRPPLENPQSTGTQLAVHRLIPHQWGPLHYPPVARWDWDPSGEVQYIGTWCGGAWCEVSQISEFESSRSHSVSPHWRPIAGIAFGNVDIVSVLKVKGWYDEQRLAMAIGMPGALMPGSARGTIFPHPALGQLDVPSFQATWVHVASTRLVGLPGKYNTQLGFREGTSALLLCHGLWQRCYRAYRANGSVPQPPACQNSMSDPWWAMIQPASPAFGLPGRPVFRCVVRRPHSDSVPVPGVARWRWKETDEKVWVRCGAGCCELN